MKKKSLTSYFLVISLFYLAANFAHPVTPTLIVERGLDSSMFGVALAAMMTMNFLFAPFWGKLCGYIPTKRIMLICGIGYAIGQGIFGAAQSEVMVVAGRMFAGVFTGGSFTAYSNYVINMSEPEKTGQNLTTLVTLQTVISAVGYFVGGLLGTISVEAAFMAQVALLASCGVLLFFVCQDDTPFKHRPEKPLTFKEANPFAAFASAKDFMTPMLALIFIIMAVAGIGYNSFEQCFNYYIKDQFGLGSQYNGTIKAVIAMAILVGNATICTYLQKKTDTNVTFMPVMVALTVVIGGVFIVDGFIPFVVIYILFSVFNAIRMPLLQNMAAKCSTPETSNSVMGFYQAMNSLGSIFGALFAGIIYASGPMRPFMLAFAAMIAATLVSVLYVTRYKKSRKNV